MRIITEKAIRELYASFWQKKIAAESPSLITREECIEFVLFAICESQIKNDTVSVCDGCNSKGSEYCAQVCKLDK